MCVTAKIAAVEIEIESKQRILYPNSWESSKQTEPPFSLMVVLPPERIQP